MFMGSEWQLKNLGSKHVKCTKTLLERAKGSLSYVSLLTFLEINAVLIKPR